MRTQLIMTILLVQSCFACKQGTETILAKEAAVMLPGAAPSCQKAEKPANSAANIIFQSTDGGQTWQDVSEGLPKGLSVGRVWADANEILLSNNKELFRSRTGKAAPNWQNEQNYDVEVTGMFTGASGLYLSSYHKGVYKKLADTGVLIPVYNTLKDKTIRTILETSAGGVLVGCESGIYKSTDGGITWKQVLAETGVNSFVEAEGVIICGTYKGVLRSTDGGESWESKLPKDGSSYRTGFAAGHFFCITDGAPTWQEARDLPNRLQISADGGKTWQRVEAGLTAGQYIFGEDNKAGKLLRVSDVKVLGQSLFCSANDGIYRSNDWGKTWEPVFLSPVDKSLEIAVSGSVIYAIPVEGC